MDVNELGEKLNKLKGSIHSILNDTGYLNYGELAITSDKSNPEEQLLLEQYSNIVHSLDDVYSSLSYLGKPIAHEGTLSKNTRGRYELDDSVEFTSGSSIEFLMYDQFLESEKWVASRVEHTNGDYYIYGFKEIPLQGLKARVRSR